ncbi:MAG: hypothetical protein MJB14_11300, partial [Spirochaetes bacterium]|nr:hypothetical protein [Spirochaetota bacterium]
MNKKIKIITQQLEESLGIDISAYLSKEKIVEEVKNLLSLSQLVVFFFIPIVILLVIFILAGLFLLYQQLPVYYWLPYCTLTLVYLLFPGVVLGIKNVLKKS